MVNIIELFRKRKQSKLMELFRKVVHLSSAFIVIGYTLLLNYFTQRIAILALTALLLLLLEIEYVRLEHKPKVLNAFGGLLRKHEKNNITGAVFLVISCIICFSAFDYWIAAIAMLMAVFGDFFAALVGTFWGKTKIYRNKTWIGTFACFAANIGVANLLLPGMHLITIPMALTGAVVELFSKKIDDNLTVPLFAGFIGQMIVYYFAIQLPIMQFTLPALF
ncbi:MAG: hypothetical protein WC269_00120 [Candidatus Gracilibacteria bacterium]|jgi:dolichol kinase